MGSTWDSGIQEERNRRGRKFLERKKTRVSCEECEGEMSESSILHHMCRTHGIVPAQTRGVDVGGGGMETHVVSFTQVLKSVMCPVYRIPER